MVAMSETSAQADLLGAEQEAAILQQRFGTEHTDVLEDLSATHGRVLSAMLAADIAHFACHGLTEPSDPWTSHLVLANYEEEPLTVADVARLHLKHA
jgi:CHAT domain-containing protein